MTLKARTRNCRTYFQVSPRLKSDWPHTSAELVQSLLEFYYHSIFPLFTPARIPVGAVKTKSQLRSDATPAVAVSFWRIYSNRVIRRQVYLEITQGRFVEIGGKYTSRATSSSKFSPERVYAEVWTVREVSGRVIGRWTRELVAQKPLIFFWIPINICFLPFPLEWKQYEFMNTK